MYSDNSFQRELIPEMKQLNLSRLTVPLDVAILNHVQEILIDGGSYNALKSGSMVKRGCDTKLSSQRLIKYVMYASQRKCVTLYDKQALPLRKGVENGI